MQRSFRKVVQMGRFKAIYGNDVLSTIDLYCEMFVGARNYWVRSIVRRLERFANRILPNEDMSCGCQVRIYVTVAMSWARGQWADLLHV